MNRPDIQMPREQVERVVRQLVREQFAQRMEEGESTFTAEYYPNLVVNISARHVHISQEDLEVLFGKDSELTVYRWLYQPGEFAAEQQVAIVGPRQKMISDVRILGPTRKKTQVELSFTDSIALGIDAPCRASGDHHDTPGCILVGPAGYLELDEGVIRAERHVHMNPADAEFYGFNHGQRVRLRVTSDCQITYENLLCRVSPKYLLEVHLDTDEGNACNLVNAVDVELLP